ncbi:MAG: hypothetical protein ACOC8F_00585 [Planctomycetota bacterium]
MTKQSKTAGPDEQRSLSELLDGIATLMDWQGQLLAEAQRRMQQTTDAGSAGPDADRTSQSSRGR